MYAEVIANLQLGYRCCSAKDNVTSNLLHSGEVDACEANICTTTKPREFHNELATRMCVLLECIETSQGQVTYSARSPSWRTMPISPATATPSSRPSGSSRAAERNNSGLAKLCSHRTSYLTNGMTDSLPNILYFNMLHSISRSFAEHQLPASIL